ncbi:MAG: hypothetical protein STSR0008_03060 [Ignavibacterium sp.]
MTGEIQKNKLEILGKLSVGLSHEIRNPLSAIKLNLKLLQMSQNGSFDDEEKEYLSLCNEAADRIEDLIENILEFSRISSKDYITNSLNEVVITAIKILQPLASRKSIHIKHQLCNKLQNIELNKNKILQVIINLITNAIEASERNSEIIVKTYNKKANNKVFVVLEVEDHGEGISEENQSKIFQEFYTSKKAGTGVGLNVCKIILDDYNAEIKFKSFPNLGTSFFVFFPIGE